MQLKFCCTHWGCEEKSPIDFLKDVVRDGFSGAEINLAAGFFDHTFREALEVLRGDGFVFIAQQVPDPGIESVEQHILRLNERLHMLSEFEPDFINSHTGKDFYSFDDNCRIIESAENFSAKTGIPIVHETHRGRFTFHLPTLLPYLGKFPDMQLCADISHWCNVSESLLEEQQDMLERIIPNVSHVHARVGWQQSAQVNDPFAPEWENHLSTFVSWWQKIIDRHIRTGRQSMTITPEAGPFPYMPQMPYSRENLADQWQINSKMKNYLNTTLNGCH
ncbi:sugar phosphate isomerase/epimerase family protein [Flavobacterium selenitireducens]|uniref:sugar phosphate isomerase/epimerase family protein n=1 Tax=Flavobacterium selenitireducens TaxID=2722704 RepID=UPI00168A82B5|nr:sugar phosphate isomerase/epimerase [Flavobacterium selenitireducens]MBD3582491.1 sugar phosphate isomerase/epimerase [Flavobacterium selenitireducens]